MSKIKKNEEFSSRWGLILAALGMAIGAGNLWRFPRLAGQYGGTFLVLWLLFLFIWSVPILLTEFSIGKRYKKGVIASISQAAGRKYAWMGTFIALCTLGITFYYSVVTAWGLRYLGMALDFFVMSKEPLSDHLAKDSEFLNTFWTNISTGDTTTVVLHLVAVAVGALVLYFGIQKGLEKVNKVLIPSLFILLFLVSGIALQEEGGIDGLKYMFRLDMALFSEPKVWIEALSQSAWSTGAGWGLILTLSSYSREKEDVTLNILISGIGNNFSSIVAGMAILPSVFALANTEAEAISLLQSGNQALTFTVIPQLFAEIPGGDILSIIFFSAFTLAAFSSLLTMIEMCIRLTIDLGISRRVSSLIAAAGCFIFGFPSAWSLDFFTNQDWVWGLGLIISGLFMVIVAHKEGLKSFKHKYIDKDSDIILPDWFYVATMWAILPLGGILIYWWMSQGYSENPWFTEDGVWNVIDVYSNATVVTQWGFILGIAVLFNNMIYKLYTPKKHESVVVD
ncbi:sodium-dependent transporter [Algivirga pacifica]|uniref:Sodium-dependent transporter n=1 Tax=Algivirga pacifica TaxID=1162670 RepID=A0ABP9DCU7_9BACT